ncbi:hypothetical protein Q8A67_010620 [Cirrhinus molitorella]|uniref:Uncharacterized protein n=1 Tax=Cirrhinus molitorella TaxID=172907 RepID=A0AA88Q1T2_9TELE|nr:hypothetical protein Q8A67_010620 [Cirrhinus molitorella]
MQRTRRRTQNVISYKFAPLRRVSAGVPRNKLLLKAALADGVLLAQHGSNRFSGFGSGQERPDGRCLIDHRASWVGHSWVKGRRQTNLSQWQREGEHEVFSHGRLF